MAQPSTSTSSSAENIARRAKTAFQEAQKRLPGGKEADAARGRALEKIRSALEDAKNEIEQANKKDMEAANALVSRGKLSSSLVARLDLFSKPGKWESMLQGVSEVAALPSPLDSCTYAKRLAEADAAKGTAALDLYRVTCPIGVLLCIFEARPEVIINIASLAIKSGNAAILKGGKESKLTAAVMSRVVAEALAQTELPPDVIQTVETREDVADLLHQDRYIDLVIPRGSNDLVRSIQREARMPVMGHADGLCLIYVHDDADASAAVGSIVDAKIDYPAACNAVETLLLNEALVKKGAPLWPKLAEALLRKKVTLRCDERSRMALQEAGGLDGELAAQIVDVKEEDYDTEFLDLELAVKVVTDIDEAIDHINAHGSNHTDAIFTTSSQAADRFTRSLSSANVFVNCSTRFADGFRYGFGTEVGISTGRIHARGPVGLEGLVTYKYLARAGKEGGVQAAGAFNAGGEGEGEGEARKWSHRELVKEYPRF